MGYTVNIVWQIENNVIGRACINQHRLQPRERNNIAVEIDLARVGPRNVVNDGLVRSALYSQAVKAAVATVDQTIDECFSFKDEEVFVVWRAGQAFDLAEVLPGERPCIFARDRQCVSSFSASSVSLPGPPKNESFHRHL